MSSTTAPALGSVLVIGGCGHVGRHIVHQLLEKPGHGPISVLDTSTNRNRIDKVAYYTGDITSDSDVCSVLEKTRPRVVIHTASPNAVSETPNLKLFHKVNVEGTATLVDRCAQSGFVKAFVYTSSSSVVHDSVSDLVNAKETDPILRIPVQQEYYSDTKAEAELLVHAANNPNGMRTGSIRPAGVFGEGDVMIIPNMIKAKQDGRTRWQIGDNKNLFDFTYTGNIALAHILLAGALLASAADPSAPKVDGEAFFITNDQPMPFWNFTRMVWSAAGDTTPIESVHVIPKTLALTLATVMEWVFWVVFFGTKPPSLTRQKAKFSCMNRTLCIDKAKERLGYQPQVSIEEGVQRAVEWALREKVGVLAEKK